jgi:hypothetical protein
VIVLPGSRRWSGAPGWRCPFLIRGGISLNTPHSGQVSADSAVVAGRTRSCRAPRRSACTCVRVEFWRDAM